MKFISTLVAASALLAAGAVQAAPIAPVPLAGAGDAPVVLARGGCGFGAHRGPFGGCRLNRGPRGDIRRAITGAPRGCPPGLYRFRGICRPR